MIPLLLDSYHGQGQSHDFTIHFNPPIQLQEGKNYEAALNKLITMHYSWYNVRDAFGNNTLKWRETSGSWQTITLTDGMYGYKTLNTILQNEIGKEKVDLQFDRSIFKAVLTLTGIEVDLRGGAFADLLGFEKKIFTSGLNVSANIPNITHGVDWVYLHCDLISREVANVPNDVLFPLSTSTLYVSYPFSVEPIRQEFHPVNKNLIPSIRVRVTDGRNNPLDLNGMDLAFSLFIRERTK